MQDAEDYYALLGVAPAATQDEVQRAARRRRAEVHPDRQRGGSTAALLARAQAVNAAADVLCDEAARRRYDLRAAEPADPFAAFAFAGGARTWFDPRDMGGEEPSVWAGLFEAPAGE
jgi:curved DNA-binding protein CbpA